MKKNEMINCKMDELRMIPVKKCDYPFIYADVFNRMNALLQELPAGKLFCGYQIQLEGKAANQYIFWNKDCGVEDQDMKWIFQNADMEDFRKEDLRDPFEKGRFVYSVCYRKQPEANPGSDTKNGNDEGNKQNGNPGGNKQNGNDEGDKQNKNLMDDFVTQGSETCYIEELLTLAGEKNAVLRFCFFKEKNETKNRVQILLSLPSELSLRGRVAFSLRYSVPELVLVGENVNSPVFFDCPGVRGEITNYFVSVCKNFRSISKEKAEDLIRRNHREKKWALLDAYLGLDDPELIDILEDIHEENSEEFEYYDADSGEHIEPGGKCRCGGDSKEQSGHDEKGGRGNNSGKQSGDNEKDGGEDDCKEESGENGKDGTEGGLKKEKGKETIPPYIARMDLEELELSVRSFNCLKRKGINTVGQLLEMDDDELKRVRNLGIKGYEEVGCKINELIKSIKEKRQKYEREKSGIEQLNALIGLGEVKKQVKKITAFAKLKQDIEEKEGEREIPMVLNMEFCGNPGTAKTTVARILARILYEAGILKSPEIEEVGRSGLVAKYEGQTAEKVKSVFESAEGRLLFIDEAYSLLESDEGFFGDEAISTIVQEMENRRGDTIVVFAGYPDKMKKFFERNPGLRSRVPFRIEFKEYSEEEMLQISLKEATDRGFSVEEKAYDRIRKLCADANRDPNSGNGRFCRNLVENAILNYAVRIYDGERESAESEKNFILLTEDFETEGFYNGLKKTALIGFCS